MSAVPELSVNPPHALQAGDQLGRYQLLCAIAQGGMGVVWAARETGRFGLSRLVAVKTALPHTKATFERVQDFLLDEAQVAASIDHPNVCKILELGQEGENVFIAMEWIQGVSLQSWLRYTDRHRLDYGVAAHVVAQACSGMHAAHELTDDDGVPLDVVHRDATPHNLLVNTNGEVKIIDFGIVKSRNQVHQATQLGEIKGKIAYLAPEQLRGAKIDRRSDVFSLGCVLYVATTGRGPFVANDAGSTITRIMQGSYTPPSALFADYPKRLEAIVMKALETEPARRFQSAEEMRGALEGFLRDSQPKPTRVRVATLLLESCGALIEERRQEIRAAQKLFESQAGSARGSSDKIEAARSGTYPVNDAATESLPAEVPVEVLDIEEAGADTDGSAAQRPPPRRGRRAVLGAAILLLCAAGASVGIWLQTRSDDLPAAPPAVAAARSARTQLTATSEPLRITVQATPKSARMTLDDGPELATPQTLTVTPDQRPHVLVVRADGYDDARRTIRFDQSQALFIALAPQGNAERASAPRTRKPIRPPRRSQGKTAQQPGHEAASAQAPVEQVAPSVAREPFSEPVVRQPPRHTIDPTDPFEKQP